MCVSNFLLTILQFEPIIACYAEAIGRGKGTSFQDHETRALIIQMSDQLWECKTIAKSLKMARPSRSFPPPSLELDLEMPPREVANAMAALYFASFESTYRILHVPTFWTEYLRYWNHPQSAPTGLRLKILLVIGIGDSLNSSEDTEAKFRHMIPRWIHAAQAWLSGPLEKDRLNITGLQIHCLTLLAREIFSIGGDLVWVSMGSLIHRAMQLGLHRDPKHLPKMSILQAEVRRRLWATILEMAVQSSLGSGMPPRISLDEFDTEAPSNNDDDDIHESTTFLQPRPKETYTTTSIQLLLLDSLATRLQILRLLNGIHSTLLYTDVLRLSSDIIDSYRACGSLFKKNISCGVTAFHRNFVNLLIRRFLMWLHIPFASEARTNPLFYYSLKVCLDTAMDILSPEPDDGFSRLIITGGGIFREGIRVGAMIIFLELMTQVKTRSLEGTFGRPSQHLTLLKQTAKDLISFSLERIQQGETNIKNYMFHCMMMAKVEAVEGGTSQELHIARAAVNSLNVCLELLRKHANAADVPRPVDTSIVSSLPDWQSYDFRVELDPFSLDLDIF